MPEKPYSFDHLDQTCKPLYAKIKWQENLQTCKATKVISRSQHIKFNSGSVFFLQGKKLRGNVFVEVHDRDDKDDDEIESKSPYGVAIFDISGLVNGQTCMSLSSPILPGWYSGNYPFQCANYKQAQVN